VEDALAAERLGELVDLVDERASDQMPVVT